MSHSHIPHQQVNHHKQRTSEQDVFLTPTSDFASGKTRSTSTIITDPNDTIYKVMLIVIILP